MHINIIRNYGGVGAAAILLLGLAGCSTTNQPPAPSSSATSGSAQKPAASFASSTVCANNSFLQKYQCSFDRIQEAAQSGDPDAEYALGYLYYYGIGTTQNKKTGLMWIERAAAQGQPIARNALKSLSANTAVSQSTDMTSSSSASSNNSSSSSSTATATATHNNTSVPVTTYLPNYGQKRMNATETPSVNLTEPAPQN